MAEVKSTVAGAALIAVLFGLFWQLWQLAGISIHWAVDILVPFALALAAAFGVAVAYYAVRARLRSR
jgi:hypothetical protein